MDYRQRFTVERWARLADALAEYDRSLADKLRRRIANKPPESELELCWRQCGYHRYQILSLAAFRSANPGEKFASLD